MAWFYSIVFALLILVGIVSGHARYAEAPTADPAQTTIIEKQLR